MISNDLRVYLSARSAKVDAAMWVYGVVICGAAILGQLLIGWLYPGWWMLSRLLFGLGIFAAFRVGMCAGWRSCWQEILRFMIRNATTKG